MSEKKRVIVSDHCPVCREIKSFVQEKGLEDKVELVDVNTPEGHKFAVDNGITAVPECVIVAEDGKMTRVCNREEFEKLLTEGT